MNRRGFLQSILVAAAAPAIVRADSLMRVVVRDTKIIAPAAEIIMPSEISDIITGDGVWEYVCLMHDEGLSHRAASLKVWPITCPEDPRVENVAEFRRGYRKFH